MAPSWLVIYHSLFTIFQLFVYIKNLFISLAKFVPSPKEAPTRSSSSFTDLYKKKYGSRKSMTTTEPTISTFQVVTQKVTYPPRPSSPRSKYNNKRFMPTPKPFRPANFPRYFISSLCRKMFS